MGAKLEGLRRKFEIAICVAVVLMIMRLILRKYYVINLTALESPKALQLITTIATLITVGILAFQAIKMKQTVEIPIKREHTKDLVTEVITPALVVFTKLRISEENSKLTLEFPDKIYIDLKALNNKSIPSEIAFIAFVEKILEESNLKQQINPYLLYDLLTIHSKELSKEFEKFLDAVVSKNKTEAEKQLERIRNVLSYLKTIVLFNESCPYTDTRLQEKIPKDLTIKVKEVKESINISNTFLY